MFTSKAYKNSYEKLKKLFQKYQPVNLAEYDEYFMFAKLATKYESKKRSEKILEEAIQKYGMTYSYIMMDSLLNNYCANIKFVEAKYNDLRARYLSNINMDLRKLIIAMNEKDQMSRALPKDDSNRYVLMNEYDSRNDSIIKNLFKRKIYPARRNVGESNEFGSYENVDLYVIINHLSTTDSYNYYKEILPALIKKGLLEPDYYAFLIDSKKLKSGDINFTYHRKKLHFNQNIDTSFINKNRKSIGLPSVQSELRWLERLLEKS